MASNILKARIVPRNGTAVTWAEVNPVLLKGEIGLEIDTNRTKYGDGLTPWNDLPYSDKLLRDLLTAEEQRASKVEETLSTHILKIRDMLKDGATLDEAKAALLELGNNYKDVFAIASTLKSFLEATDTADATINKWTELKAFLDGITDTESLAGLLADMEAKITEAYTQAIEDEFDNRFGNDVFILDGGTPEGW